MTQRILLIAAALVLASAVMAAAWQVLTAAEATVAPVGRLNDFLPRDSEGVTAEDLPLGDTELVTAQTREMMDYDDVIHRSYTTQRGTFTVYVGYWGKGRVAPNHVSAHVPDRCWTLAGMSCTALLANRQVHPGISGGNWRRFSSPGGGTIETVFWHVAGTQLLDYGNVLNRERPLSERAVLVVRDLFFGRKEQYFVRLNSTKPIDSFAGDPGFERVMASLAALGIRRVN